MATSASVAITYVPADCGSLIPGKSKAPKAFQDVNIVTRLRDAGIIDITEHHALDTPAEYAITTFTPGTVRNEELNISVLQKVERSITANLKTNPSNPPFQLILGGECAMSPAILSALSHNAAAQTHPLRVGFMYIDADTDLTTPKDPSSTGNLAGMNMAHLLRTPGTLQSMQQFSQPSGGPLLNSTNTVFFGLNMSHPGNKREHFTYLFENNYQVISSTSIARDPESQARKALDYLEANVDIIMVHLDVDAIDPVMFPLANLPNFTGVGFDEMMRALGVFLASEKVVGLTVAEVNPDHDPGLGMVDRLTGRIVDMLALRARRRLG